MSETSPSTRSGGKPKQPLGLDRVLFTSIRTTLRRYWLIFLIYGVSVTAVSMLSGYLVSGAFIVGYPPEPAELGRMAASEVIAGVASMVIFFVPMLMLLQLGHDSYSRRTFSIKSAFWSALRSIPVVIVTWIVLSVAVTLGMILLIVPGLWLIGVFTCVPSATMIERRGFGAFGRSAELTKGYRWPIVGTWLVMFVIVVIISLLTFIPIGLISAGLAELGSVGIVLILAVQVLAATIQGGFLLTLPGVIHARLVEIKEGTSSITDIFD